MKSEFMVWFMAQFGKSPMTEKQWDNALQKRSDLIFGLKSVQDIIKRQEEWEVFKKAALYAWNAAIGEKK